MCHLFAGLLALRVDPVPQLLEAGSHGGLSSGAGRRVRGRASHCGVDWGTHPGRSLRRGAGGVSTRTKARGTAMTGVGCSAPTLATVAVERPLLYDALMLVDEQTNAGPSGRGASLGASGVSHGMSGAAHRIRRGHCGPAGLCGRPRSVASNPNVGEAGTHSPLGKSRGRSLPLVPAVPAARFPQPHSASSSWASIIGNDPCTTREPRPV